jgi:hypothetical protein
MFRLTIDLPPAPTASSHPDREAARAELLRFLAETGQAYRVTSAGWLHTSYDILERPDHQALLGRAAIDEVCTCDHTHDEHDDIGCTVTVLENGQLIGCECRSYEPVPGDPALFDLDACLPVGPPGPT